MKYNWKALAAEVIACLSQNERQESIVYLEQRIIPAREILPWGGITQCFEEPVVMAFIDLEPTLNWMHRGRYFVLGAKGGILLNLEADRPPFLTGVSPYMRLIHIGSKAPDWAAVTSDMMS